MFASDRCRRYYQKHCLVLCPPRVCEKKWISRGGIIFLGRQKRSPGRIWMLTGKGIHVYNQCKNHEIAEVTVMLYHRRRLVFCVCRVCVCAFVFLFSLPLTFSSTYLFTPSIGKPNSIMLCIKRHLRSKFDHEAPEPPRRRFCPLLSFHLWHFHPRGVLTQAHMVTRMEVSLSTRRRVRLICRDCSLTGGVLQGHTIKFSRAVTFKEAAVLCFYTLKTSALSVG